MESYNYGLSSFYSNYLFPVISLILLQYLFHLDLRMSKPSIAVVLLIVFLVNLPAVAYDNKVPLHRESIPERFFKEKVFQPPSCASIVFIIYTKIISMKANF